MKILLIFHKIESCILLLLFFLAKSENAIQTNGPSIMLFGFSRTLYCKLTDEVIDTNVTKFIWFKDGVPYKDLPEDEKNVIVYNEKDYTLTIRSRDNANKDDIGIGVGDYTCVTGDRKQNATIKVRTKPWLYLFEDYQKTNYKSANIIEGDKFFLKCEVIPEYARDATVKWYKYNESEHESDTKHLIPLPENDPHLRIVRANDTKLTLIIDKVKPSDGFYYVCEADNKLSTTNNTILLRVKDKLGALWPFLAIVGEVVILCTIIFVYEKRRTKPDFDESQQP